MARPSIKKIAEYWSEIQPIPEIKLNFDWSDAHTQCWNCGDTKYRKGNGKTNLERCHIKPKSLEGDDYPSNFVLLCTDCHKEAPNINDSKAMWEWIGSNYIPFAFYGTYRIRKALVMFKMKEGYSFFDKAIEITDLHTIIANEMKNISNHGFNRINHTTYYFLLKRIIKNYYENPA